MSVKLHKAESFWEANNSTANQKCPHILWTPKVLSLMDRQQNKCIHHTQPKNNNHLHICIVSLCEMCITKMQTWTSQAFLKCRHVKMNTTNLPWTFLLIPITQYYIPHPYPSIVRPVHPVTFSSHLCSIPYNTANSLAMYKGTANSPQKVWNGGDGLYWECPDRSDGSLPKFCNCKLEHPRRHKHCNCTKKW